MSGRTVVRGGTVVDGSGAPGYRADVAVENGRITAIAPRLSGAAGDRELDATGHVVAPGFVDVHTHYDAQVFWDPDCTPSIWHGVTTAVLGNCGFSIAPCRPERRDLVLRMLHDLEDMREDTLRAGIPWGWTSFGEYLDAVEAAGPGINVAGYVGHSALRVDVMGEEAYEREATAAEIAEMRAAVRDALDAGAVGFATSASPTGRRCPSRFAGEAETAALLDELRLAGRGVASFVPGGAFDHARLYEIQPQVGRPFTWTAMLVMADGRHREWAELHRAGRARGADVRPQVSCRPLVAQCRLDNPFGLRTPGLSALEGASHAERTAAYRDPAWRVRLADELTRSTVPPRWDTWTVAESVNAPHLTGRSIADIAADRGAGPLDVLLDLGLADDLATRFTVVLANDDEAEVAELLRLEGAVLGLSDAGAHPDQICDAVAPTDLLGGWVRERGVLGLEHAIHKLTGEPAALFGLDDRGRVAVGAAADLVVLDPGTVAPGPVRRVNDLPAGADRLVADTPAGLRHVLVNGVAVRVDGDVVAAAAEPGRRPGTVLRPGRTR